MRSQLIESTKFVIKSEIIKIWLLGPPWTTLADQ